MGWTLQHGGTTQSLEAWGISNDEVVLNSFAPSTLSFDVPGNFDATPLFAHAAQVTLRDPDNVVRFVGRRRKAPQSIAGNTESRSYYFEDVLGDLNRRTFRQVWQMWNGSATVGVPNSLASLFSGSGVGVSAQLTAIIAAAAAAGIAVQMGTSAGITAIPRATEIRSLTFLQALKMAARLAPDLGTWVDYTTSPPTVNFVRRTTATEHTTAVIEHADSFSLEPLHEQLVPAVVINYNKTVFIDNVPYNGSSVDKAPAEATGDEENALVAALDLRDSRLVTGAAVPALTQSQDIGTENIDASSFSFWEGLWPALAGRNEAATLTDGTESPSGLRRIVSGAQPGWAGSAQQVTVTAIFNGVVAGQTYVNKQLVAVVNGSSLSSGTYTREGTTGGGGAGGSDPGETAPTGIAALLLSALSVLQWSGRHLRTAEEADWSIKPSHVVSFSGTAESAHATARAQVVSVSIQPSNGTRELNFGPSPVLPFDDLIEVLRSQSTLQVGASADDIAGTSGEGSDVTHSVLGSGMGPGGGMVPTPDATTHPFKVSLVGSDGDLYRVEAGTVDGYTIAAQTLDIGSSRPRGIRVALKFNTFISNSQYLYNSTLKTTTGNAPVLEVVASAACLDVTAFDTSGDGARCLIAIINAAGAVEQIATGNIVSTRDDDASLTGAGMLSFNKGA